MTAGRHLPVRPAIDQLRHEAKDLLRQVRRGDPAAVADLIEHHPGRVEPGSAKLANAQLALARSYGVASWSRLMLACRVIDAIWLDDADALRALAIKHPPLIYEMARGTERCDWGPPMSYAANLGRDRIIEMLQGLGATDFLFDLDRATLHGKIDTARKLYDVMGRPCPPADCLGGPAFTLSATGTTLILEFGALVRDADGKRLAPVDVVLETDSRKPAAKHQILEMYVQHGLELPDTPTTALHSGRIDLLEEHLRRDPRLLERTFSHEETYPPEFGYHDEILATHGTPLAGGDAPAYVRRLRRDGDRPLAPRPGHESRREGRHRRRRSRRTHDSFLDRGVSTELLDESPGDAAGGPVHPDAPGPWRRPDRSRLTP